MNQLSPYFFKPYLPGREEETIDLRDFRVVEEESSPSLREYWLILRRHLWLIASCAFALSVGAALYTFTRIPLYTAQTTLLIERKPPQVLKVQDARSEIDFYDYNNEFYKTQYEILKSPALAERVIRDEQLHSHPLFAGDKGDKNGQGEKKGLVAGLLDAVETRFAGFSRTNSEIKESHPQKMTPGLVGPYLSMLQIKPVSGTSLVQILFTTPDPGVSSRLANAHAFAYVRYGVDLRSRINEEAIEFLQQKLLELKERVEQSEASLNSYRRDKGIISLDDKENLVVDRLFDLNKKLTAAESERIALEAQVRTTQSPHYDSLPVILNSPVIQALKAELGKFEAEYASLSKEFKPGYPPLDNLRARLEENRRRLQAEMQRELKGIEAAYEAAKRKEAELRARMEEQKRTTLSLKDSGVQYAILAREVDTNRQLYDSVLQRLKEMGVAAELRTSNVYVMGKATPPGGASYPNKRRSLLLGLLMGLAGGIGLAFLLEQLDNTFKSPEEAERYTRLPNLGVVPDFSRLTKVGYPAMAKRVLSALPPPSAKAREDSRDQEHSTCKVCSAIAQPRSAAHHHSEKEIVLAHHPLSLVAEAYRSLRSSILLSHAGGAPQTILMTSATRGEGKTTTLVNTAIVFAQMGVRVLVIDADLRRPRCHELLNLENRVGLAELLTGQIDLEQSIQPTSAEDVYLMSSGSVPPNPAELLGSKHMRELLQHLRLDYDFVFIDSSPVLAVSDAVLLSDMAEGTLVVVSGKTPKQLIRRACARLRTPHSNIMGILLNRVDIHNGDYATYYRHYYEYYQQDRAVGT